MAIQRVLMEAMESLARDDIDPNIINCFGNQALGYAAYYGNVDILKLLLNHPGIDLNFVGAYGYTALMLVVKCFGRAALGQLKRADYRSRLESAKLLLERICVTTMDGPYSSGLVSLLLSHPNTDPNAVDNNGVSIFADFMNGRHRGNMTISGRMKLSLSCTMQVLGDESYEEWKHVLTTSKRRGQTRRVNPLMI